jgi:mannose-1-phosphate guanylyltransferase
LLSKLWFFILSEKHLFQKKNKNNRTKNTTHKGLIKKIIILTSKKHKKRKEKLTQEIPKRIFQKSIINEPTRIA